MNMLCIKVHNPATQQGSLMVATLLILLVISLLGMASVDSTGLEMKMSSNSRQQQQVFEAAEYTLSWVENNIAAAGYFKTYQLNNGSPTACGAVCFSSACTNGYCFNGTNPTVWDTCTPVTSATVPPATNSAIWANGSGKYKTLDIPGTNLTTKYIIEFWCYASKSASQAKTSSSYAAVYRITTLATGEDGRARVMLRSTIRAI